MTKTRWTARAWKAGGQGEHQQGGQTRQDRCVCRGTPPPPPPPGQVLGALATLTPLFGPRQAQRITAAGSAASASWTSCAPRSVAVRVPLWTAPTRSWPASQATSPNTSPICKSCLGVSPPRPHTPSHPEPAPAEAPGGGSAWPSHAGTPWLS